MLRHNLSACDPLYVALAEDSRSRRYYDMEPARELFRRRQQDRIREGTFGG